MRCIRLQEQRIWPTNKTKTSNAFYCFLHWAISNGTLGLLLTLLSGATPSRLQGLQGGSKELPGMETSLPCAMQTPYPLYYHSVLSFWPEISNIFKTYHITEWFIFFSAKPPALFILPLTEGCPRTLLLQTGVMAVHLSLIS